MTSACLKSNNKVQDEGVYGEGCQGDRDIDESHGGGLNEGVIHCRFPMTQDKGTVSEEGRDFSQGTQSSEQNGARKG